jgi:hypothetical protein
LVEDAPHKHAHTGAAGAHARASLHSSCEQLALTMTLDNRDLDEGESGGKVLRRAIGFGALV